MATGELREVDPSSAVESFSRDVPTAPVPGDLPDGWRATSAASSSPVARCS